MRRFKRIPIATQLFLAVLLVATLAVVATGVAGHRSFQHGFLGYLNGLAINRLEQTIPRLEAAYAESGSWDFLRREPRQWVRIMVKEAEGYHQPGFPPASDLTGTFPRATLLDVNHNFVIGYLGYTQERIERPVRVRGETVGWLALTPFQTVTEVGAQRFEQAQLLARMAIIAGVILIAAAMGWWASQAVMRPIRRVARATHALAGGDYTQRVPDDGSDEVGRLARDFNHLAATLERNEAQRREFMAGVAHELRTPLGIMHGELEAIEDGIRPLNTDTLRSLQGEVRMLSDLVNDLYELSLSDMAALSYRKTSLDLRDCVTLVAESFAPRFAQCSLTFKAELADTPVPVFADAGRLRQLLGNLLENACRYTDAGGQIRLVLQRERDAEGRWIASLCIEDTAPGVPPELLSRLFDRFYRVDASRNRASGGAGLGLSICRNIVQAHAGQIDASASALGGIAVTVTLPLAEGA